MYVDDTIPYTILLDREDVNVLILGLARGPPVKIDPISQNMGLQLLQLRVGI